jgi:hypothetical protein
MSRGRHRENEPEVEPEAEKPATVDAQSDDRTLNNVMRHEYRVLTDDEKAKMLAVKDAGVALLKAIQATGHNRHNSLAITRIEEGVMWCVKGITG